RNLFFNSHLYTCSIGQSAADDFNLSPAHDAFELLLKLCWCGRRGPRHASSHTAVHGFICQAISLLVVLAKSMTDRKPIELRNQFFCPTMQVLQDGILDLVDALNLPNE